MHHITARASRLWFGSPVVCGRACCCCSGRSGATQPPAPFPTPLSSGQRPFEKRFLTLSHLLRCGFKKRLPLSHSAWRLERTARRYTSKLQGLLRAVPHDVPHAEVWLADAKAGPQWAEGHAAPPRHAVGAVLTSPPYPVRSPPPCPPQLVASTGLPPPLAPSAKACWPRPHGKRSVPRRATFSPRTVLLRWCASTSRARASTTTSPMTVAAPPPLPRGGVTPAPDQRWPSGLRYGGRWGAVLWCRVRPSWRCARCVQA
eukprot:COSAG01_NODE_1510_length_10078_cov_424.420910_8_plen_259_part_00